MTDTEKLEQVKLLVAQLEKYRYCMGYDDSYFGEPPGLVKRTVRELNFILDPTDPNVKLSGL